MPISSLLQDSDFTSNESSQTQEERLAAGDAAMHDFLWQAGQEAFGYDNGYSMEQSRVANQTLSVLDDEPTVAEDSQYLEFGNRNGEVYAQLREISSDGEQYGFHMLAVNNDPEKPHVFKRDQTMAEVIIIEESKSDDLTTEDLLKIAAFPRTNSEENDFKAANINVSPSVNHSDPEEKRKSSLANQANQTEIRGTVSFNKTRMSNLTNEPITEVNSSNMRFRVYSGFQLNGRDFNAYLRMPDEVVKLTKNGSVQSIMSGGNPQRGSIDMRELPLH